MEDTNETEGLVFISEEGLKELEILESSIPCMIENAVIEYKKLNLNKLQAKAKPAAINSRVKQYVTIRCKENNKRKRKQQKQQKQRNGTHYKKSTVSSIIDMENQLLVDNTKGSVKVQSIFIQSANKAILKSDIPVVLKQAILKHEHEYEQEQEDAILPINGL